METSYFSWLSDPYLITILFTELVIGVGAYSMFVLPKKQEREAAEAAKRARVVELRKAA